MSGKASKPISKLKVDKKTLKNLGNIASELYK
jgi:hypothetical protein